MFEEKYGIEIIHRVHYYNISLIQRIYDLERSTPFMLEIGKTIISATSWGRLVEQISDYLLKTNLLKKEEMLKLELDWTKQDVFMLNRTLEAHKGPLSNGLYVNTNHTSMHLLWIVQDLLRVYKISGEDCKLLIRKAPRYEIDEVRMHFYNNAKIRIKEYILKEFKYSIESIDNVIENLEAIDKHFNQMYPTYNSLLLFESKQDYALIKSRFLAKLKIKISNDQTYIKIKVLLDMLTKYYGIMYPTKTK